MDHLAADFEIVPGFKLRKRICLDGTSDLWKATDPTGQRTCLTICDLSQNRTPPDLALLDALKQIAHAGLLSLKHYWCLDRVGEIIPSESAAASPAHSLVLATDVPSRNLGDRLRESMEVGRTGLAPHKMLGFLGSVAKSIDLLNSPAHTVRGEMVALQHCSVRPISISLVENHGQLGNFSRIRVLGTQPVAIVEPDSTLISPYAAPELFKQRIITKWSDQFSLAMTYIELRAARIPINHSIPLTEFLETYSDGSIDLSVLPPEEATILARATAAEPDSRYASCTSFIEALRRVTEGSVEIAAVPEHNPTGTLVSPPPQATPSNTMIAPPAEQANQETRSPTTDTQHEHQSGTAPDIPAGSPPRTGTVEIPRTPTTPGAEPSKPSSPASTPAPPQPTPSARSAPEPSTTGSSLRTDFTPDAEIVDSNSGSIELTSGGELQRLGRYEIKSKLGEGNMGTVYRAYDTQLERDVALKVPKVSKSTSSQILDRFLVEARAMASIRHPHVCPVYDAGKMQGRYYLSMALVGGRTLSDWMDTKSLSFTEIAEVVAKCASALHKVHDSGIIHRDIKPSNIMIDEDGEPLIMDFGLARGEVAGELRLTAPGTVMGTPAFMSPEQVGGDTETIDCRTDIYSLGVVFYELLTGDLPFRGSLADVLGNIRMAAPQSPCEKRPDVPAALNTICNKAMMKKPADRYATSEEFAQDLFEFAASTKFAPKKNVIGLVAVAALIVALVSLGGLYWFNNSGNSPLVQQGFRDLEQGNWMAAADAAQSVLASSSDDVSASELLQRSLSEGVAAVDELLGQATEADDTTTSNSRFTSTLALTNELEQRSGQFQPAIDIAAKVRSKWIESGNRHLPDAPEMALATAQAILEVEPDNTLAIDLKNAANTTMKTRAELAEVLELVNTLSIAPESKEKFATLRDRFEDMTETQKRTLTRDLDKKILIEIQAAKFETFKDDEVASSLIDTLLGFDLKQSAFFLHLERSRRSTDLAQFDSARDSIEKAKSSDDKNQHQTALALASAEVTIRDTSSPAQELLTKANETAALIQKENSNADLRIALARLLMRTPPLDDQLKLLRDIPTSLSESDRLDIQSHDALRSPSELSRMQSIVAAVKAHPDPDGLALAHASECLLVLASQVPADAANHVRQARGYLANDKIKESGGYGVFVQSLLLQSDAQWAEAVANLNMTISPQPPWLDQDRLQRASAAYYQLGETLRRDQGTAGEAYKLLDTAVTLYSTETPLDYLSSLAQVAALVDEHGHAVQVTETLLAKGVEALGKEAYGIATLNARSATKLPDNSMSAIARYEQLLQWYESGAFPDVSPPEFYVDVLLPAIALCGETEQSQRTNAIFHGAAGKLISDNQTAAWKFEQKPLRLVADYFDKALTLYPQVSDRTRAEFFAERGVARTTLGEASIQELLDDGDSAIKADPDYAGGWGLRGYALSTHAQRSSLKGKEFVLNTAKRALADYSKGIELLEAQDDTDELHIYYTNVSNVHVVVANSLPSADLEDIRANLNQAVIKATKAKEFNESFETAYGVLGNALEDHSWSRIGKNIQRYPEAVEAFQNQIELFKFKANGYRNLGRCYAKWAIDLPSSESKQAADLLVKAREQLEQAYSRDPADAETNFYRGLVALKTNDDETAYRSFAEALKISPFSWLKFIEEELKSDIKAWDKVFELAIPPDPQAEHAALLVVRSRIFFEISAFRNSDLKDSNSRIIGDATRGAELATDTLVKVAAYDRLARARFELAKIDRASQIKHLDDMLKAINLILENDPSQLMWAQKFVDIVSQIWAQLPGARKQQAIKDALGHLDRLIEAEQDESKLATLQRTKLQIQKSQQ